MRDQKRQKEAKGCMGLSGYKLSLVLAGHPSPLAGVEGEGQDLLQKLVRTLRSWAPTSGKRKSLGVWDHTESSVGG